MSDDRISVIDAAARLGTRKQTVFKLLRRLGIESEKLRSPERHGQRIAYITKDEYRIRGTHTLFSSPETRFVKISQASFWIII